MDKLYILDASGYIYRSYFAIRQMTNARGESTNALFGFVRSILKLIKDFNPTHLVAVFDGPNNSQKRTELYPAYKAHRKEMPKDLLYQILWSQRFCQLMGIPELMVPGVEADDTMGSIAKWAATLNTTAYICTSDKDMCQLVSNQILILNTFKDNLIIDANGVKEQFGVMPAQMIDYLAIIGDASDNIPGLTGFGPKTAADLLEKFGSLDYILEHPLEVSGKKKQDTLISEKEKVLLSKKLVIVDTTVSFPNQEDFFKLTSPAYQSLKEFYAEMNFSSLIRELEAVKSGISFSDLESQNEVVYQLVNDEETLVNLISYLSQQKEICLDTETTDLRPLEAQLVGIGLGVEPKKAWYIPLNGQLNGDFVLSQLKPLLENPSIGFYGHNFKYDYHVLRNHNISVANISFDTILASYLLNSHKRQHSLDHLALELFDKVKIAIQELIGKGKNQLNMKNVALDKICHYCCEDVDYTIRLKNILLSQLEERKLTSLLFDLELPLLSVLAQMERNGIFIDTAYLKHLSQFIGQEIHCLEQNIYALAGEIFNINSPKQLSQILFHKLGIKPPKKIATGHSTNAEVLEILKHVYPIAEKLLEYRTLEKLRSTYVNSLPLQVNAKTGRIHCNFNQSMAATGRLSCQDPNLQNIPVRTEVGRQIREAFRPEKEDWSYLSADYSQIELRLLAHLSEDPVLIKAFLSNEDIHKYTASLIFDVPLQQVSSEQRYQAKAVNFGLIYGQQAFGLAHELGIDTKTAAAFIQRYFERYGKVKEFLEACKQSARETGKAVTMYGRERLLPEIRSQNAMIRATADRFAVNTPIQGTQADLIKMAMLKINKLLIQEKKKGFMILQIHDELIFEVPNQELESISHLVKNTMENIINLKVPLIVNIHIGKNWKEC
ncbi:DNA polymerase I [Candidatus Protochlamydia sp. R18]|uniref:DNA polymerase I n=1 Tax=Candidatus Protochlamydia sp. R18 TaxID=1353977 RepID=UPI0005A875B3|nr:DNA polymerase I [Candidatus Protochlamydia sp. R18]